MTFDRDTCPDRQPARGDSYPEDASLSADVDARVASPVASFGQGDAAAAQYHVPTAVMRSIGSVVPGSPVELVAPARPRAPTSGTAVQKLARRLFERYDPATPSKLHTLLRQDVQHYYADDVLGDIGWLVSDVFANGSRLYVEGACLGVGASTLACDYARAFNFTAGQYSDGRRVLYARFEPGTDSIPKFYDTLGLCLRAPLTATEVRFRGPLHFAARVLSGAVMAGATAIILDHVSATPPKVRNAIATLLRLTDPNYHAPTEIDEFTQEGRRIGIIIVDHVPPERLFANAPDVLLLLRNRHTVLRPYETPDEVGQAMQQAGIGLEDFDISHPEDFAMAASVLEKTRGLPAQMTPFFELIGSVTQLSGGMRPTPELLDQVLPMYRSMVDVLSVPAGPLDESADRLYGVYASNVPMLPAKPRARGATAATSSRDEARKEERPLSHSASSGSSAAKPTRSQVLRERRESRDIARKEGKAIRRKQHVNFDFGETE